MATETLPAAPAETVTRPTVLSGAPHIAPVHDVLETLPPAAQERFGNFARGPTMCTLFASDMRNCRRRPAQIVASKWLQQLQAHPQDFGFNLAPDDARVVAQQALVAKLSDDLRRLKERGEARLTAWQATSQAKAAVKEWLKSGRPGNTTLEAVEIEPPKLNKGESVTDAIERLRRRVRELRADHHRVASAPYPSTYCKQRMHGQIEALAMQGAPDVSLLVEHGRKIQFQTQRVTSEVHGERRLLGFAEIPDAVALFAWTFKDQVIAKLSAEIDSESDDAAALSPEVRKQREAEVMGDLLAVERDESTLVWRAQSENLPCEHRSDCAPQAILGVRLVAVSPTNGSMGRNLCTLGMSPLADGDEIVQAAGGCPSPGRSARGAGRLSSAIPAPNLAAALVGSKIGCERAGTAAWCWLGRAGPWSCKKSRPLSTQRGVTWQ